MKPKSSPIPRPKIFTIGHSTRTIDTFLELLQAYDVRRLVDVRTIPRSRHNPQFNQDVLPEALNAVGIEYVHMEALGGLRHSRADSTNTGWRNASFRGFADYMQTPEFESGLQALIREANLGQTVIMCAEAVPWRCHRSMIGDALTVSGYQVADIMSLSKATPHTLTSFAKVKGRRITYPTISPVGEL